MERPWVMDDWEWAAGDVYKRAGITDGEPRSPDVLARKLGIRVVPVANMVDLGAIAETDRGWVMGYRASQPPASLRHTKAHELGHWAARVNGLEDTEANADLTAAAILMPPAAFRRRLRAVGIDPRQLALPFKVSETSAALRLGELERMPLALVAPATVRVRGPEEWVWPEEQTIRRWAREPHPGLVAVRLRDDRRRTLIREG